MNHKKIKVMLVDDDPVNNLVNQKMLTKIKSEIEVMIFGDGRSALSFFLKQPGEVNLPELILLDINMPIMNGWQFLDEFCKLDFNINVFMLTSSIAAEDIEKSHTYSFVQGFITKPLSDEKTRTILKAFL